MFPEPRIYISELKIQLDVIQDKMRIIRNRGYEDNWHFIIRKEDRPEWDALRKRKAEIEKKIIEHNSA